MSNNWRDFCADTPVKSTDLVGAHVSEIWFGEEVLTFLTDHGEVTYRVDSDCCDHSYFFDFYGVDHLLNGYEITEFERVDLAPGDVGYHKSTWKNPQADKVDLGQGNDYVQVYGYRITSLHPTLGEVTSVFSFRNVSNGYYGGSMCRVNVTSRKDKRQIFADVIG